jgi:hypothetical protein
MIFLPEGRGYDSGYEFKFQTVQIPSSRGNTGKLNFRVTVTSRLNLKLKLQVQFTGTHSSSLAGCDYKRFIRVLYQSWVYPTLPCHLMREETELGYTPRI